MKSTFGCFILVLLMGVVSPLFAREIASVNLPDEVRVGAENTILKLNGAGIRNKFLFKIYVAGLYLPASAADVEAVLNMQGPKRVLMHFVYKEVPREKLVDGWNEGFAANNDDAQLALLQPRLHDFNALFATAHAGDEIWLDWIPTEGSRVSVNGEVKGIVPGEDFYRALLRVWLGENPVSEGLRDGLLGR